MGHTYAEELQQLSLSAGQTMYAECALVILKAMLEEGVSVLGGWPGAPVSNLTDVFEQSYEPVLKQLGVFVARNVDEKSAAAMLAESIKGPVRSAVAFKSVGLNHAADTLAHIASSGVMGGAVVFVGEDYGCSSTVVAERMLPYARKSAMPLLEPKASIPHVYQLVKHAFHLSEYCASPVYFVIQTQVGNMKGCVRVGDNRPPMVNVYQPMEESPCPDGRMPLPPASQKQEEEKMHLRLPRARDYVHRHHINDFRPGASGVRRGFITHGYIENIVLRVLEVMGEADPFGRSRFPTYTFHCLFPLVEEEIIAFLQRVNEILIVEEGFPNDLEEGVRAIAQKHRLPVSIYGKDVFTSNVYTPEIVREGIERFLTNGVSWSPVREVRHGVKPHPTRHGVKPCPTQGDGAGGETGTCLEQLISSRDPQHCTGCPIRPLHANIAIMRQSARCETAPYSGSARCESAPYRFAIAQEASCCILGGYAPFYQQGTMTGMGTGLASALPHAVMSREKVIAFMGDGTFWHSGLTSSVINAVENEQDCILYIILNFHTAMTGGQANPSTPKPKTKKQNQKQKTKSPKLRAGDALDIERSLRAHGAKWVRVIDPYDLKRSQSVLNEAIKSPYRGPKFIISMGECMLMKQRRVRAWRREATARGRRVEESHYLVDPHVCTGCHSCIGINGCPALTILPHHPNLLRLDRPVTVDASCLGCGLCGENAHVAKLCPSFAKLTKITNPTWFERLLYRWVRYPFLRVGTV